MNPTTFNVGPVYNVVTAEAVVGGDWVISWLGHSANSYKISIVATVAVGETIVVHIDINAGWSPGAC